jgi:hypothetical protein
LANTTFIDGQTPIKASWLNDVNEVVYNPSADVIPASSIINTPAGNIAATNVQTAINELDSEKQPLNTQLTALAGMPAARATALASSYLLTTTIETDLNNIVAPGVYNVLGTTNSPLAGYWVFLEVFQYISDPTFIMQRCSAMGDSVPQQAKSFLRYRYVGSVWSAWHQVSGLEATTAEMQAGTVTTVKGMSPFNIREAFNATGTAPVYACRAWANFNGTGTVAIRASGNVSSITDNGVGDYTINFTTAMPDANLSVIGIAQRDSSNNGANFTTPFSTGLNSTTTSARVITTDNLLGALDCPVISVAIFR